MSTPQVAYELREGDDLKRLTSCYRIEETSHHEELDPSDIKFIHKQAKYPTTMASQSRFLISFFTYFSQSYRLVGPNSSKITSQHLFKEPKIETHLSVNSDWYRDLLPGVFFLEVQKCK